MKLSNSYRLDYLRHLTAYVEKQIDTKKAEQQQLLAQRDLLRLEFNAIIEEIQNNEPKQQTTIECDFTEERVFSDGPFCAECAAKGGNPWGFCQDCQSTTSCEKNKGDISGKI